MFRKIKDTVITVSAIALIVGAFVSLVVGMMCGMSEYNRYECEKFCESSGHDGAFNPALGCFCDDENGRRYNPKHLVPPGTEIRLVE